MAAVVLRPIYANVANGGNGGDGKRLHGAGRIDH